MDLIGRFTGLIDSTRMRYAHMRHSYSHRTTYEPIRKIVNEYRRNGGLSHNSQSYKLFCLEKILEERRPRNILELGSGTTTAVFANYVRRYSGTTLTVIDESERWLDSACHIAQMTPTPQFTSIFTPAYRRMRNTMISYDYDWLPDRNYDFVLIDGPSLHKEKTAINGNILDMLAQEPDTILVDVRETTAKFLFSLLLNSYAITLSDIFENKYYPGYNYFSVFRKMERLEAH